MANPARTNKAAFLSDRQADRVYRVTLILVYKIQKKLQTVFFQDDTLQTKVDLHALEKGSEHLSPPFLELETEEI